MKKLLMIGILSIFVTNVLVLMGQAAEQVDAEWDKITRFAQQHKKAVSRGGLITLGIGLGIKASTYAHKRAEKALTAGGFTGPYFYIGTAQMAKKFMVTKGLLGPEEGIPALASDRTLFNKVLNNENMRRAIANFWNISVEELTKKLQEESKKRSNIINPEEHV